MKTTASGPETAAPVINATPISSHRDADVVRMTQESVRSTVDQAIAGHDDNAEGPGPSKRYNRPPLQGLAGRKDEDSGAKCHRHHRQPRAAASTIIDHKRPG